MVRIYAAGFYDGTRFGVRPSSNDFEDLPSKQRPRNKLCLADTVLEALIYWSKGGTASQRLLPPPEQHTVEVSSDGRHCQLPVPRLRANVAETLR